VVATFTLLDLKILQIDHLVEVFESMRY